MDPVYDISGEIQAIQNAHYGREVRQTIVNALNKLNTFAGSIDLDNLEGGDTTVIVGSGSMYRLDQYAGWNPDADPKNMHTIIQSAINEAKTNGFQGLIFPKDSEIHFDDPREFTRKSDGQLITGDIIVFVSIPENFGIDLNGSTIYIDRIAPTGNIANTTTYTAEDCYKYLDVRPYCVFSLSKNNSFLINGKIEGGADIAFPSKNQWQSDGSNPFVGTGVSIEGSHNVVENMIIRNVLNDGIRFDNGWSAPLARPENDNLYNKRFERDFGAAYMFKGPTTFDNSTNTTKIIDIGERDITSVSDFKYDATNKQLVSTWIRLSGGYTIPQPYLWYTRSQTKSTPLRNPRSVDMLELGVKELKFVYQVGYNQNTKYRLSSEYFMDFATDSDLVGYSSGTGMEGTFAEYASSANSTHKTLTKHCRMGIGVGFEGFGYNPDTTGKTTNTFVDCNPFSYTLVKLTSDPYELNLFNNAVGDKPVVVNSNPNYLRNLKQYYYSDGTPVDKSSVNVNSRNEYYIKKSPIPLVRVRIPVRGLDSLDDIINIGSDKFGAEYNQNLNLNTDSATNASIRVFPMTNSSTYLRGIIEDSCYNTANNIVIENAYRNGVTIGDTHHSTLSNFVISSCNELAPRAGIDFEEGGVRCHHNTVKNGRILNAQKGITYTKSQENFVEKTVFYDCYEDIYGETSRSITIRDCIMLGGHLKNSVSIFGVGQDPLFYDFTSRRLINCDIYGSICGTYFTIDGCKIRGGVVVDKHSKVSNCSIHPADTSTRKEHFAGKFYNCSFTGFLDIGRKQDVSRGVSGIYQEDEFYNCTFDSGKVMFDQLTSDGTINVVKTMNGCSFTLASMANKIYSDAIFGCSFDVTSDVSSKFTVMGRLIASNRFNYIIGYDASSKIKALSFEQRPGTSVYDSFLVYVSDVSGWALDSLVFSGNIFDIPSELIATKKTSLSVINAKTSSSSSVTPNIIISGNVVCKHGSTVPIYAINNVPNGSLSFPFTIQGNHGCTDTERS